MHLISPYLAKVEPILGGVDSGAGDPYYVRCSSG